MRWSDEKSELQSFSVVDLPSTTCPGHPPQTCFAPSTQTFTRSLWSESPEMVDGSLPMQAMAPALAPPPSLCRKMGLVSLSCRAGTVGHFSSRTMWLAHAQRLPSICSFRFYMDQLGKTERYKAPFSSPMWLTLVPA